MADRLTDRQELVILRDRALDMIKKGAGFEDYSAEWPSCPMSSPFDCCHGAPVWVPLLSPYCYRHTIDYNGGTRDLLEDPLTLEPYRARFVLMFN